MRLVAEQRVLEHVVERGGDLYLWPRGYRCCGGRAYVLEAATEAPEMAFRRVRVQDGVAVWATPGLAEPEELHVELGRRGTLSAYSSGRRQSGFKPGARSADISRYAAYSSLDQARCAREPRC